MIFPPIARAAWVVNARVMGTLGLAATRSPAAMAMDTTETAVAFAQMQVEDTRINTTIRRINFMLKIF